MNETLEVGGLSFEVRRSSRRKILGLTVDRGGELVIHSPDATAQEDLARWTKSKLLWVHQKLMLKEELAPKGREPEFVNGESFSYLGRLYRLQIVAEQDRPLLFDGHRFYLRRTARAAASDHFRAWFIAVGKAWIEGRVQLLATRIGVLPSRIEVRDLGFRWGSCGKGHRLNFHWALMTLPRHAIDYVVVHELAHIEAPTHNQKFWRTIERTMPDYQQRKSWLDCNGGQFANL